VALVCAVAGCTHSGSVARVLPVPPPLNGEQVADTLYQSLTPLDRNNYAFTFTTPRVAAKGVVSQKTASVTTVLKGDGETDVAELRAVGSKRWIRLRVEPASSASPWFRVDPKKLTNPYLSIDFEDVTGVGALVTRGASGRGNALLVTGELGYVGDLDIHHGLIDKAELDSMGKAASSMPYRATMSRQHQLTEFTLDVPKSFDQPAGRWDFTFTGYDQQQPQTAPTGKIRELPPALYEALNG